MILKIALSILALLISGLSVFSQESTNDFLSKKELCQLYDNMTDEIEKLDAEGIEVRNKTKDVSWKKYKRHHRKQFKKAKSYSELKMKFELFGNGFVCGHSDFEFLYPTEANSQEPVESNVKLGFTYPTISFFDLETKQTIEKINEVHIDKVFYDFVNYHTSNNSINDCQMAFKRSFEKGRLLVNGKIVKAFTFSNGDIHLINYKPLTESKSTYEEIIEGIKIDSTYKDWKIIKQGYKVAVLQQDEIALVKIKDFVYLKGQGGEINCKNVAKDSTHCSDVQIIKESLNSISPTVNYLIIDLQGNYGGQESTRFLAELCPNEFYDLRVRYRKTKLLENKELRSYLFYGSERAENWYQNLHFSGTYNKIEQGEFLPARADFCQGDSLCRLKPISTNENTKKKFDKIVVLVNEGTASSGDDFAYRMKEYGNALIAGQPQSADLTYSLVSILYYRTKEGIIEKRYLGNRQRKYKVNGTELFKFSIPYSQTVDKNNALLQGKPLKLDLEVALTKSNFLNREKNVLDEVIRVLINNE